MNYRVYLEKSVSVLEDKTEKKQFGVDELGQRNTKKKKKRKSIGDPRLMRNVS